MAGAPTSPTVYARIIGVFYLALFFLGPLAFFMGRTGVYVPTDPVATMERLMESAAMFRVGIVAETLVVAIEIVISALLFFLLGPVHYPLALAATFARLMQAVLQAVSLFTAVPALLVLRGSGYPSTFSPEQWQAWTVQSMEVNAFMIMMWGLFFGFHLLLLGLLVYRAGFWPKVLGILLMAGALGYLAQSYGYLLIPRYNEILQAVVVVLSVPGELAFTIWLLWKGMDERQWHARVRSSL